MSLQTFMNIFQGDVKRIIIPNLQRDYAQGRDTTEIRRVRSRFLDALYKAVTTEQKTKLDFVYGDLEKDGTLTLLDGQQRLTTLFLLHWYAAKKENLPPDEFAFLKNFSYETRLDSKEFCNFLIDCQVSFDEKLSTAIEDNADFPLSWKKDPTVSSMLIMLDAINEKFHDVENLWGKLKGGAISFYFLSIANLKLDDGLYVTMNSRGKPLTDFEHFKAEFKSKLDEIDGALSDKIISSIDTVWTDLLWSYRDKNNLIDDGFLAYFNFLCDVILYRKGSTPQGNRRADYDAFDLLEEFFDGNAQENVTFMKNAFDCWYELAKQENIPNFFGDRVTTGSKVDKNINHHESGKIITYFDDADFFGACLKSGGNFLLGQTVMLYAFLTYLLHRETEKISDADFRRRIRIVNNLVTNSNDELSNRKGDNRISVMLEQVDDIIIRGEILQSGQLGFNVNQLAEECEKILWTQENPDKAESLFELEDHYLLYGQIGVVGLDYPENFARFISLFKCDYDKISCALLLGGDYYQTDGKGYYQLGSTRPQAWQNLFHRSAATKRFEDTKISLENLLGRTDNFTDAYLDKIIEEYLAGCENKGAFDWLYYYMKYSEFRPPRYGKYRWENFKDAPYCFLALWAEKRRSNQSYQPFLKAAEGGELSQAHCGERLIFDSYYVVCENSAYVVKNLETDVLEDRLEINQQGGVDAEDRIKKFSSWAKGYLY